MEISTKELRSHSRLVLDTVQRGETVTITYRGRPSAQIIGIRESGASAQAKLADSGLFGLWADREDLDDVATHVRELRQSRFP